MDFSGVAVIDDPGYTEVNFLTETVVPEIVLTDEQANALDQIMEWLKRPGDLEYRQGGYAGTGKTTLIKKLIQELGYTLPYAVEAFTGKAVAVLRKKGIYRAQTMHSLLYKVKTVGGATIFEPVPYILPQLVITDEASMVSTQLYEDLKRHNKKMLFVGDPAQLEPVGDNPNLMRSCHNTLTGIHRQAADSPIIRLAHEVREGDKIKPGYWESPDGASTLLVTDDQSDMEFEKFDIQICAKNATRHQLNQLHRFERGWEEMLRTSESIICLQNVKDAGLYNGMILDVVSIVKEDEIKGEPVLYCHLIDDLGQEYPMVPVSKAWFGQNYVAAEHFNRKFTVAFDYAYAITGHKSQGSEWDNVGVYREYIKQWDMKRWDYTAITRAAKHLTYCI